MSFIFLCCSPICYWGILPGILFVCGSEKKFSHLSLCGAEGILREAPPNFENSHGNLPLLFSPGMLIIPLELVSKSFSKNPSPPQGWDPAFTSLVLTSAVPETSAFKMDHGPFFPAFHHRRPFHPQYCPFGGSPSGNQGWGASDSALFICPPFTAPSRTSCP